MIFSIQKVIIIAGIVFIIYIYFFTQKISWSTFFGDFLEKTSTKSNSVISESRTSVLERTEKETPIPIVAEHSPKTTDIVLAELSDGNFAILWNGKLGVSYHYSIRDTETKSIIVESDITSSSSLVKIKSIPLVRHRVYQITVGDTKITAKFTPPHINSDYISNTLTSTEIRTDIMPTDVEIMIDGKKISTEHIGIFGDPQPGLKIDMPITEYKELVIMVYNGPNVVYILTKEA